MDALFEFTLPVFPGELTPGQQVKLTASGEASGYMRNEYFGAVLIFTSEYIGLRGKLSSGEEVTGEFGPFLNIDIDHETWNGETWETQVSAIPASDTLTIEFEAPGCDWEKEFSVMAFL